MTGNFFTTNADASTSLVDVETTVISVKNIWLGRSIDGQDIVHLVDDVCGLALNVSEWQNAWYDEEHNMFLTALIQHSHLTVIKEKDRTYSLLFTEPNATFHLWLDK